MFLYLFKRRGKYSMWQGRLEHWLFKRNGAYTCWYWGEVKGGKHD